MVWQDLVISVANVIFAISLIHQVYFGFKEKKGHLTLITSSFTVLGLLAITISFFSLKLYYSSIMSGITCFLWFILLIQTIIYR